MARYLLGEERRQQCLSALLSKGPLVGDVIDSLSLKYLFVLWSSRPSFLQPVTGQQQVHLGL